MTSITRLFDGGDCLLSATNLSCKLLLRPPSTLSKTTDLKCYLCLSPPLVKCSDKSRILSQTSHVFLEITHFYYLLMNSFILLVAILISVCGTSLVFFTNP